jgi:DICT domain-containing protein
MSKPLVIGELARRTGVHAATLRAWEARHGFPQPERRPDGTREYAEDDVRAVGTVLAERAAGATLAGAIARARAGASASPESVFAALGEAGQEVSKRGMTTLSRALEDELVARAEAGVLVGLFQERRHYEASAVRWEELARQAAACAVFADFAEPSANERPARVPLRTRSQLAREWAVVHVAERSSALLVGRERLDRVAGERTFEAIWSVDPHRAQQALSIAVRAAAESAPRVADALEGAREQIPATSAPDAGFVGALMTRAIRYFDESRPELAEQPLPAPR